MTGEPPQRPDPNVGRQSAPGQGPPATTGQPAGQPGYGAPDDRGSIPGPPGHGAPAGEEGKGHQIEREGRELRSMMPWIEQEF